MSRIVVILTAFFAAALVTPLVRRAAFSWGAVDMPDVSGASESGRKRHEKAMPLFGGAAVFAAMALALATALALGWLPGENIKMKFVVGIVTASALLVIGGALDDRFNLKPARQIVWPALATLVMVVCGVGIRAVSNPFGGIIPLDGVQFTVLWWQGIPYKLTLFADLFTVAWLMGMTYTTKLLDGLDGLVSGTLVIGAVILAFVSVTRDYAQPDTVLVCLAVAGAFAGFLLYNFPPASIFLGEGGSTLAGFLLGTLAIISGGKIAAALLVLGLPILDAALVIIRRAVIERRSPFSGDRTHLHFRLLDRGFSPRQVLLTYWLATALLGTATFFLQGEAKLLALVLLALGLAVSTWLSFSRDTRGADAAGSDKGISRHA
ncbi:MAG: hypothetical protein RLZZ324_506 [Candidatus Parcubacteria bacterium]|jgi:UDP-GlcNAc:undecaprenyl-phosphate GlcNAc-1-phosphate transferase